MKLTIYTDGFEGWANRARARAKAMDAGEKLTPSRGITFESPAEMIRLLTPARLDLLSRLKEGPLSMKELATTLGRDVSAVRRDVAALQKFGVVDSRQVVNPGHGRSRVVSAPDGVTITARL